MEAWAKTQISDHFKKSVVSIWPSNAVRALRRQTCFSEASDYDIRRAVMKHASKINFSIRRGDQAKYSPNGTWPPWNRFEQQTALNTASARIFGTAAEPVLEEYKAQWETFGCNYVTLDSFENGLPDKEEYFTAVWRARVKAWEENGFPIPAHMWPRLRLRLLSADRLGKAAMELPFKCPLCHTNTQNKGHENNYCGEWFIGENERNNLFCWPCTETVRQLRYRVKLERERERASRRADVPQRIPQGVAWRALKELGIYAARPEAMQIIKSILNTPEKEAVDA